MKNDVKIIFITSLDSVLGKKYERDLTIAHNLFYQSQQNLVEKINPKRIAYEKINKLSDVFNGGQIIACLLNENNLLIGYSRFLINPNGNKFITIFNLFVDLGYRKQGLGKKLLSKVLEVGKESGSEWVGLSSAVNNEHVIKMYKKLGFFVESVDLTKKL